MAFMALLNQKLLLFTVEHHGELVTYGVNDMVLDTWGKVEKWVSNFPIVSFGPSGIGFVN